MRARALLAVLLLLVPALAEAQRIPVGRRPVGPPRGEPLGPQPPSVARELAYKRLNYAVESYPMIARFETNGFVASGVPYGWTAGGAGTQASYRLNRVFSATLDVTSSFLGGPAMTSTAELGARIRAPLGEQRFYPFMDLRAGYLSAYQSNVRPFDVVDPFRPGNPVDGSGRYSHGFGGVGGVGMEVLMTRSISVMSEFAAARARMREVNFRTQQTGPLSYRMTTYRYMLGLRWNPGRFVPQLANDPR